MRRQQGNTATTALAVVLIIVALIGLVAVWGMILSLMGVLG